MVFADQYQLLRQVLRQEQLNIMIINIIFIIIDTKTYLPAIIETIPHPAPYYIIIM